MVLSWMMQSQEHARHECAGTYGPTKETHFVQTKREKQSENSKWVSHTAPFSIIWKAIAGKRDICKTQRFLCDIKKEVAE